MSKKKKIILSVFSVLLILVIAVCGYAAKVYFDVKNSANTMYEKVDHDNQATVKAGEPFSVLLLGIDTGDLGRTDQGRSDTMMVATVNPKKNETTLVSIARDTYTEIVGHGTEDKINHAYAFGGAAMSMASVSKLLDIPINYYVTVNLKGLQELVDAVGGIEVENKLDFSQDDHHFAIGKLSLNGEEALAYSRMRYEDPNGDYGRQERQRQVVAAIAKKALSINSVTNYQNILKAMEGNIKTDMTWDEMQSIALNDRDSFSSIKSDQLQGDGFMQDGVSYQRISDEELARVRTELDQALDLDYVNNSSTDSSSVTE